MNSLISFRLIRFSLLRGFGVFAFLGLVCGPRVFAEVKTWTGAHPTSHNWSVASNWDPSGAPRNGDDLIFPDPDIALKEVNTNNILNLRLRSITFQGNNALYHLWGNGVTISNTVNAGHTAGINTVHLDSIALGAEVEIRSTSVLIVNSDVLLNGFPLVVNTPAAAGDLIFLNGVISGAGSLSKDGLGMVQLGGAAANTYAGLTTVRAGQLTLGKPDGVQAVPDSLVVGDGLGVGDKVLLTHDNQIGTPGNVEIKNGATLDLNNHDESVGTLTLDGGTVVTGTGTLGLGGTVTVDNTSLVSTMAGNVDLGSFTRVFDVKPFGGGIGLQMSARVSGGSFVGTFAGMTFRGGGTVVLSGANTFRGLVSVQEGHVIAESDGAFGTIEGGVVAELGGRVGLQTANVGAEALTLKSDGDAGETKLSSFGNCGWGGNITLNGNQTILSSLGTLTLSGAISGTADLAFDGATIRLSGPDANTYVGITRVFGGVLELDKTPNRSAIPGDLGIGRILASATVRYLGSFQLPGVTDVSVFSNALLDLNGFQDTIGSLNLTGGRVETGAGLLGLGGNITVNGSSVKAEINGRLDLNATRVVQVFSGTASPCDLEINAVIVDGGITKRGPGVLCLNANNTFAGPVRVEAGELRIDRDKALGTAASGTTVLDGATLYVGTIVNNLDEPLTLSGSGVGGTNGALRYLGAANWRTNVVLITPSLIVSENNFSALDIQGVLTGSGTLTKGGAGRLRLSGNSQNTLAADVVVADGVLEMAKTTGLAVTRNLVLGTTGGLLGGAGVEGRNLGNSQVGLSITVRGAARYELNGFEETISTLHLVDGGDVDLGTGQLLVFGNIVVSSAPFLFAASSTIGPAGGVLGFSGVSSVHEISVEEGGFLLGNDLAELTITAQMSGAWGLRKTGTGDLLLNGNNSYTGRTFVDEGDVWVGSNTALGNGVEPTEVNGQAVLGILGDIQIAEDLELNSVGRSGVGALHNLSGTNSCLGTVLVQGTGRLDVEANTALRILGRIWGPGGVNKEGLGRLEYVGTTKNTYTGTTRVSAGRLYLAKTGGPNRALNATLFVGDGEDVGNVDMVETDGAQPQIGVGIEVNVRSTGLFRVGTSVPEVIRNLSGEGRVFLDGQTLKIGGNNNASYLGVISGTGELDKDGDGFLSLKGDNTYTGRTLVRGGKLYVGGSQSQSEVTVFPGGTLSGTGFVGDLEVLPGGTLEPGNVLGTLSTRDLLLRLNSKFVVHIAGPSDEPLLGAVSVVNGSVINQGAILEVDMASNAAPVEGMAYEVIQNGGVDPTQGLFFALPNGATFFANNGQKVRVEYNALSGNDVRLVMIGMPLRLGSFTVSGGNLNSVADVNECNLITLSLLSEVAWPLNNVKATLKTSTPGVVVTQWESDFADIPPGANRGNLVPFQFSTLPGFQCGTNIQFRLEVETETNGTFTLPSIVFSGTPGTPLRVNRNVAVAIPDVDTVESSVNVAGFSGHLGKVAVSLHIAHNQLDNLELRLVAPDGTQVLLSSDNGGTANDYGTGCSDAERTVFDPAARRSISAASESAPYVGTFRPEGNLDFWRGRWQTGVNGTWTLRVTDDAPGGLGSLNCWSLFLYPAECVDGGGICESCNGPFVGEIKDTDAGMTQRLDPTILPSTCSIPKSCPGLVGALGAYRYDVYRFTNGVDEACVTVKLSPGGTVPLQSVAYLGTFDPTSPCLNYIADSGRASDASRNYSFKVLPGQVFEVLVQSGVDGGVSPYRVSVEGFECPPPVVNIAKTDDPEKVRLWWSTAYPAYRLETTPNLTGAPWLRVITPPSVVDGKFSVTNIVASDERFFQLNKP